VVQHVRSGARQCRRRAARGARQPGLTGPDAGLLDPAALGGVLTSLGELPAKFTAAQAGFLRRFDAAGAHDGDGYNTSSAWLSAMTQLKPGDARAAVAQMRTLARHPHLAGAMAAGAISPSWTNHLDRLTRKLPAGLRDETDQIVLRAAAAGASLEDLAVLANVAAGQYLAGQPGPAMTGTGSMSGSCRCRPPSAGPAASAAT
jgi:hypothetical protein